MLILKGDKGKSVAINFLCRDASNIVFEYYYCPVFYNSICVNSTEYSLEDFKEFVKEQTEVFEKEYFIDKHYDYFIVYTNEKEEDLKDLMEWLNANMYSLHCKDIIVTCK